MSNQRFYAFFNRSNSLHTENISLMKSTFKSSNWNTILAWFNLRNSLQFSFSIPPEIIRKPEVFWCSKGVKKWNISQMWVQKLVNNCECIQLCKKYYWAAVIQYVVITVFLLTHFTPLISFYTSWKDQKTSGFPMF